jgi:spore maturation protein SpmB
MWMIPISLAVTLLDYSGILMIFAGWLNPVFNQIGLSGQSSLVFITSALLNIYSAIAVIGSLSLTMREVTILAIMCLISHNLIIETIVQKKTGSSAFRMLAIRLGMAIFAGVLFNWLLPASLSQSMNHLSLSVHQLAFSDVLQKWTINTLKLLLKVSVFVFSLMIIQRVLEEFGILKWLSMVFKPFMRIFGLPEKSSFLWIVANVVGLMYGSAIMFEELKTGKVSKDECDLLNHHTAVSHSLLEDTLLFVAIGVPVLWIIIPRLILAIPIVWTARFFYKLNSGKVFIST